MRNLYMIACVSQDLGLGKDGQLLWNIPEDMQFFRETTANSVVIMGRKTYESVGQPLPRRRNIILSRHDVQDVTTYHDKTALDAYLNSVTTPKFIIGGASLYQMYLDEAEKLYLTEVAATKPADTYFPSFDKSKYQRKVIKTNSYNGINFEIVEYTKKIRG